MNYNISTNDNMWNVSKNNYNAKSNKEINGSSDSVSRADEFDIWTNSEENYEKAIFGEDVQGFQMFELNLSTYSSDLKEFAQEYIDKYDEDGDGVWSKEEFTTMAAAEQEIPEEFADDFEKLYSQLFSDLNIDTKDDSINAGEFASYLYASDLDWENYAQTGDVASSIDGNLDYLTYQSLSAFEPDSTAYSILQQEKQDFYNNFYAE